MMPIRTQRKHYICNMINRLGNTAEQLGMNLVLGDTMEAANSVMEDAKLIFT